MSRSCQVAHKKTHILVFEPLAVLNVLPSNFLDTCRKTLPKLTYEEQRERFVVQSGQLVPADAAGVELGRAVLSGCKKLMGEEAANQTSNVWMAVYPAQKGRQTQHPDTGIGIM